MAEKYTCKKYPWSRHFPYGGRSTARDIARRLPYMEVYLLVLTAQCLLTMQSCVAEL